MAEKKAILAVSFGTTADRAREEEIASVEKQLAEAFPDYVLRRAFTSTIVRKRLAEKAVSVPGVSEALRRMQEEGITRVWIQPTHLIPGTEYHKLLEEARQWQDQFESLQIGEPLLFSETDMEQVLLRMRRRFRMEPDCACIFMGHGSCHEANSVYETIAGAFAEEPDCPYFMATVEGTPSLFPVLEEIKKRKNVRRLLLVPFMLVAGEHAFCDMAGSQPESWKSICQAAGYQVSCILHGMGAYPEIRELYVQKCRKCVNGTFYGISVGPGEGGALTLEAVRRIRSCPVLAVPRTKAENTAALSAVRRAAQRLEEMFGAEDYMGLSQKEFVYLDFLMIREEEKRREVYRECAERLLHFLQDGKDVGMVVLGDVSVYATAAYLAEPIRAAGFETVMLPGVTSFCASAAALGRSLTKMDKPLHIIPAGCEGLTESLLLPGSKVLMKSGRRLPEVKQILRELGLYEQSAMVKDCGMETQELCRSLDEDTGRSSYFTTVLVPEDME